MAEDENDLPPEPGDSGSEGTQESAEAEDTTTAVTPSKPGSGIAPLPLTETVEDFYESGIRGQAAMHLLGAHIHRFERDLDSCRSKNEELQDQLDQCRERRFEEKREVAVLSERLTSVKQANTLRRVMLTLGGLIGGTGFSQLTSGITGVSVSITLFGSLLLIGGWLLPLRRSEGQAA